MRKQKTAELPSVASPFGLDSDAMQSLTVYQLEAMSKVSANVLEGVKDWHSEVSRFVSNRLEKDTALQHALCSCQSPNEVFETYTSFMQDAMAQYTEEMNRLGEIMASKGAAASDGSGAD